MLKGKAKNQKGKGNKIMSQSKVLRSNDKKIVLPAGMSYETAIKALQAQKEHEEQVIQLA